MRTERRRSEDNRSLPWISAILLSAILAAGLPFGPAAAQIEEALTSWNFVDALAGLRSAKAECPHLKAGG